MIVLIHNTEKTSYKLQAEKKKWLQTSSDLCYTGNMLSANLCPLGQASSFPLFHWNANYFVPLVSPYHLAPRLQIVLSPSFFSLFRSGTRSIQEYFPSTAPSFANCSVPSFSSSFFLFLKDDINKAAGSIALFFCFPCLVLIHIGIFTFVLFCNATFKIRLSSPQGRVR